MLLRANSQLNDMTTDLKAVTEGSKVDSGVPHGQLLTELVEVTLSAQDAESDRGSEVRRKLVDALGAEGLVDAAAIVGNFQRMVRIADGTGIPLDRPVSVISANLRADLGIDQFFFGAQNAQSGCRNSLVGRKIVALDAQAPGEKRKAVK